MPKVIFISSEGKEHIVTAACGLSAMEAAVQNLVPGIDGDCGGVAACGTCHVWVDAAWSDKTGPAAPGIEAEMLALTAGNVASSRLACQIKLSEELDGLVLRMPTAQH